MTRDGKPTIGGFGAVESGDWRQTTRQQHNRRIFEEELDPFLPQQILDFHVHLMNPGVVPAGQTFSCAGHPISCYTLDDLKRDLADALPGRQIGAVCFGYPDISYDRQLNNAYVASCDDGQRFFALRLFDPHHDSPEALRGDLASGRFRGLKPYPDYVRAADVSQVEVTQMLPPWAMEIADEFSAIVLLHIPRKGRLADPVNQQQVRQLCARYPNVRIVLAHVGRAYYLKNAVGQLERLADLPNLYFDVAMVNHEGVLEHLFKTIPPHRILFGSDTPIALAPGKSVEINDQYTYVTPVPWHLSISDGRRGLVFTSFLYEELRAIKRVAERLGLSRQFLERLFHDNGMRLLMESGRS